MEPLTASLMAIGSGSASGLRPYFTVFALGLAGVLIPEDAPGLLGTASAQVPDTITNPWVLALFAVLALGDFGVDKVLGVNLPFETISQIVRPIVGTMVGHQLGSDSGAVVATFGAMLGFGTAVPVSLGKGSFTAALTAALPEPVSQVLRSLAEDVAALVLIVLAILAPFLAAVLGLMAVAIGITLFLVFRKAFRTLRTKFTQFRGRRAELKALRAAQVASGERVTLVQKLRRIANGATPAVAAGVAGSGEAMRSVKTASGNAFSTLKRQGRSAWAAGQQRWADASRDSTPEQAPHTADHAQPQQQAPHRS